MSTYYFLLFRRLLLFSIVSVLNVKVLLGAFYVIVRSSRTFTASSRGHLVAVWVLVPGHGGQQPHPVQQGAAAGGQPRVPAVLRGGGQGELGQLQHARLGVVGHGEQRAEQRPEELPQPEVVPRPQVCSGDTVIELSKNLHEENAPTSTFRVSQSIID